MEDYRRSLNGSQPAFAELKGAIRTSAQLRLLANSEALVISRFAVTSQMILLHAAGDSAGCSATASAEGGALMASIGANFDQLAEAEQGLLGIRSAASERTGRLLLRSICPAPR